LLDDRREAVGGEAVQFRVDLAVLGVPGVPAQVAFELAGQVAPAGRLFGEQPEQGVAQRHGDLPDAPYILRY
jgi:hypothetical protein